MQRLTAALRRHWKEVMRITGVELNTADDVFKLQHLLDAHLSDHRDEIEELCACAVKEEQVLCFVKDAALWWTIMPQTVTCELSTGQPASQQLWPRCMRSPAIVQAQHDRGVSG